MVSTRKKIKSFFKDEREQYTLNQALFIGMILTLFVSLAELAGWGLRHVSELSEIHAILVKVIILGFSAFLLVLVHSWLYYKRAEKRKREFKRRRE